MLVVYPWTARDEQAAKDFLIAVQNKVEYVMPDNIHYELKAAIESDNPIQNVLWLGMNHAVVNDCILIESEEFWKNLTKLRHITYGVEIAK